jgi:hypothetical protein
MLSQENSQDQIDFLLSKVSAQFDEVKAEQQRLTVRSCLFWCALETVPYALIFSFCFAQKYPNIEHGGITHTYFLFDSRRIQMMKRRNVGEPIFARDATHKSNLRASNLLLLPIFILRILRV